MVFLISWQMLSKINKYLRGKLMLTDNASKLFAFIFYMWTCSCNFIAYKQLLFLINPKLRITKYIILCKNHNSYNKFNSISSCSSENIMTARISPFLFNLCPKVSIFSLRISEASTVVSISGCNNSCLRVKKKVATNFLEYGHNSSCMLWPSFHTKRF